MMMTVHWLVSQKRLELFVVSLMMVTMDLGTSFVLWQLTIPKRFRPIYVYVSLCHLMLVLQQAGKIFKITFISQWAKLSNELTQLFFFISLVSISSNFPLPANEEETPCFLDIEKSCTSDKSIGFFNMSAILTFGKLKSSNYWSIGVTHKIKNIKTNLDDKSIGVNVLDVPGIT